MRGPGKPAMSTVLLFCMALTLPWAAIGADTFAAERRDMVAEIDENMRQTAGFLGKSHLRPEVRQAMLQVPRHRFVPRVLRGSAYENRPLPIGYGQTISQPYIVAIMTDLLELQPRHKVLEIGTGSGYQAAVLAQLETEVYTMEIIKPLAEKAGKRLQNLGYDKVRTRHGDGYYGWSEHAPYDAIIVTAAASHVPPPLIAQLKVGGKMIIPVGGQFLVQQLLLVEKNAAGEISSRQILPVAFVPLTGGPR